MGWDGIGVERLSRGLRCHGRGPIANETPPAAGRWSTGPETVIVGEQAGQRGSSPVVGEDELTIIRLSPFVRGEGFPVLEPRLLLIPPNGMFHSPPVPSPLRILS